ncbi:hypothetical protein GPJ56_000213 [Histomonas meleagridis]|uniref:uncharacterized protein n=1 Tax=Histomonas meleagridis TaxID=135588 RepID=UPI0035595CDA|nr:hypothetical protein GPJ56_000213 [Histomonas meleagridis]KAH0799700.1 hypothetical protein GO595_007421 [Histomonas meleagridis]
MLVPSNTSQEYGVFGLTEDDKKYFCFSTIPAIYNFLLTNQDRQYALEMIKSLFKLHFHIHGFKFSAPHKFLKDIVFGYFLATNPGHFFENVVQPLIPDLLIMVNEIKLKYIKTNAGAFRNQYWQRLSKIVISLFNRLNDSIPLLPSPARELIVEISKINTGRAYPTKYVFIIDTMICGYLEHFVPCEFPFLFRDMCRIIRCCCSRNTVHVDLAWRISAFINEKNLNIEKFIAAVNNWDKTVCEKLSYGLETAEKESLFTTRDFNLIYEGVKHFIEESDPELIKPLETQFVGVFQSITAPKVVKDDEYILLQAWKSPPSTKVELNSNQPMDILVDTMNILDLSKTQIKSPSHLTHLLLRYCDPYLDIPKKVKIESQQDHLKGDEPLKALQNNYKKLKEYSDRLFSGLYFVSNENERTQTQLRLFHHINIQANVVPTLALLYPLDFLIDHQNIDDPLTSYNRLTKTVASRTNGLGVLPENQEEIQHCFFLEFVDQIDQAFHFQSNFMSKDKIQLLATFSSKHTDNMSNMSTHGQNLLSKASSYFQRIDPKQRVSQNTKLAVQAMTVMRYYDDIEVQLSIAISLNLGVFAYISFFKKYINLPQIVDYVLTKQEQSLLTRLARLTDGFDQWKK